MSRELLEKTIPSQTRLTDETSDKKIQIAQHKQRRLETEQIQKLIPIAKQAIAKFDTFSAEDKEDILQQISTRFILFTHNNPDFVYSTCFEAYWTIASKNICINLWNSKLRQIRNEVSLFGPINNGADSLCLLDIVYAKEYRSNQTGEQEILVKEAIEELYKKNKKFKTSYYQVMVLHYLHDLTHGEIAKLLEIEEATSKTRLHRGKQILKTELTESGVSSTF